MRKIFTLIAAVAFAAAANAQTFVYELSCSVDGANPSDESSWASFGNDWANLSADEDNWVFDSAGRWFNTSSNCPSEPTTMTADGKELNFTKGLKFFFTRSAQGILRLDPNPTRGITINNNGGNLVIPNLKAGDEITYAHRTGSNGQSRTWTVTNATVTSGSLTSSTGDFTTVKLTVDDDGDVTFCPSAGMSVNYILVMRPATGISNIGADAEASINVNAQKVNLLGQPVGESYKGIVVSNGKKFVRK